MSTRGINFLHRWISNNIPETAKSDVISIHELTHKLFFDAKRSGSDAMKSTRKSRACTTVLDWIVHFDPGLPE